MEHTETIVPSLWHFEVMNELIIAERRHIITKAQLIDYVNQLSQLPIRTDLVSPEAVRTQVISLAREYQLIAYDVAYLELTLRTQAQLARSFDTHQLIAATRQSDSMVFEQ